jgi:Family of unknown function (DUF5681)
MNGSDDSDKDKMVGYGRPPAATRFQKGQSGNPKGRPKGRKSVGKILRDALHRTIEVRDADRVRTMSKIEAVIEVTLNKALKGDHRSFAKLMDVADKLGIIELLPAEQKIFISKEDVASAREKLARLLEIKVEGIEAASARRPRRRARSRRRRARRSGAPAGSTETSGKAGPGTTDRSS